MGNSKKKKTNFLVQGSILAMASIISRIIGLIYRIPMTDTIGDVGNNYYNAAFEVYSLMLIISSYSLPLAVSKLVSAQMAKKRRKQTYRILKGALLLACTTGLTGALIVYFCAGFFTDLLKTPYSIFALKILAPAILIVAILGVLRGFFQGMGTMMPSAVSQIIEQVVNAVVSVWAAYVLFQEGKKIGAVLGNPDQYAAAYGAAGGTLGTSLGAVAALLFSIFVFILYMTVFKRQMRKEQNAEVDSFGYTMKILILTIIPVLLSTTIYNVSGLIDQGIFKNIALLQGHGEHEVDVWWGVFSGKYKLMINVPISIASALAASSAPSLAAVYERQEMDKVRSQINAAIRFIMVIAFPCTVGLAVLALPIFTLLFPGTVNTAPMAAKMMYLGAAAVLFYSLSTLTNGLLQGINRLKVPVINAAIALVAHVILLILLMLCFRMDINAVVLANVVFAFLMCVLNAFSINRYSGCKPELLKTYLIPAICSGIMGVVTFFAYKGIYYLSKSNLLSILLSMALAVIVYAVAILLLKGVGEAELLKFPKGQLLVKAAKKTHLLK